MMRIPIHIVADFLEVKNDSSHADDRATNLGQLKPFMLKNFLWKLRTGTLQQLLVVHLHCSTPYRTSCSTVESLFLKYLNAPVDAQQSLNKTTEDYLFPQRWCKP